MKKALFVFLFTFFCVCSFAQTRPSILDIKPIQLNTQLATIHPATSTPLMALTLGYLTPGDGGEGLYWWNSTDTSNPDQNFIVGTAGTTGRWFKQRPHLWGDVFGTSTSTTLLSLICTDPAESPKNPIPLVQVQGTGENGLGAFSERETAGLFVQNTAHVPLMDEDGTGVTYTANTVTKVGAFAGKKLKRGMVIDTKHGGGLWPDRCSGLIQSWTDDTITVGAWYAGGSLVPASYPTTIPSDGVGFWVNPNTKAWCIHTNLYVHDDDYPYAKKGVIMEAQIWNESASATTNGTVLGFDCYAGGNTVATAPYAAYRAQGNFQFGFVAKSFNDSGFYVTPSIGGAALATPSYGFRDDSNSSVMVGNGGGYHDYFFRGLDSGGSQRFTVLGASGYTNIGGNRNPVSTLEVDGSFATGVNQVLLADCPYSAGAAVHTILAAAGVTINLPASTGLVGRQYVIKNIQNTTPVFVVPNASETIDAVASYTIPALGAVTVVNNGGGWWVTSKF